MSDMSVLESGLPPVNAQITKHCCSFDLVACQCTGCIVNISHQCCRFVVLAAMVCFSCPLCALVCSDLFNSILPNVDRLSAVFAAKSLAKEQKYYGCIIPAGGFGLPPNTEVMRLIKVDLPQPESYQKLSNQA